MTTNSITINTATAAIGEATKLAWDLIEKGRKGAYEIDNAANYVEPVYTLYKRIEALGLELEALAASTAARLGIEDDVLERVA